MQKILGFLLLILSSVALIGADKNPDEYRLDPLSKRGYHLSGERCGKFVQGNLGRFLYFEFTYKEIVAGKEKKQEGMVFTEKTSVAVLVDPGKQVRKRPLALRLHPDESQPKPVYWLLVISPTQYKQAQACVQEPIVE